MSEPADVAVADSAAPVPASSQPPRDLRISAVGLVVGLLFGLGIGYLAWGTDTASTANGSTGLGTQSSAAPSGGDVTSDGLVQQGLAKHNAGDTAGAAVLYNQALAIDPRNSVALFNLGVIAHFEGDLDTARTYYEQAVAIDPKFPRALNNLGLVLIDQGEAERGQELLDQATALQSGQD